MADPLVPAPEPGLPVWADDWIGVEARANAQAAEAAGTRRAYDSACRTFHRWAAAKAIPTQMPLPAQVVVGYIAHLTHLGRAPTTIRLAVWAIGRTHKRAGLPDPTEHPAVGDALTGYTKRWVAAGNRARRVSPMSVQHLRGMVALPPVHSATQELRDRALLLLAVALAARRSELCALQVHEVRITKRGMMVYMARSKTDQLGAGAWLGVPRRDDALCATAAVQAWLEHAQPTGPLLCRVTPHGRPLRDKALRGGSIARIIQDLARRLDDPSLPATSVAGHSPRATLVTMLMAQGVDAVRIAQHTRHRTLNVLRIYDRGEASLGERSVLHKLYVGDDEGGGDG